MLQMVKQRKSHVSVLSKISLASLVSFKGSLKTKQLPHFTKTARYLRIGTDQIEIQPGTALTWVSGLIDITL